MRDLWKSGKPRPIDPNLYPADYDVGPLASLCYKPVPPLIDFNQAVADRLLLDPNQYVNRRPKPKMMQARFKDSTMFSFNQRNILN